MFLLFLSLHYWLTIYSVNFYAVILFPGEFVPQVPADLLHFVINNPDPTVDGRRYKFMCTLCGKTAAKSSDARDHVENAHFPNMFEYECEQCNQQLKSKFALKNHRHYNHRANSSGNVTSM